jgi:hypothetical protein
VCGIHGVINGNKKIELNSDDFVKQGYITNMLRGTDSAGIGVADVDGYNTYQKLPVSGLYFPQDRFAKKLIEGVRSINTATMCHVRAATVGGVSYANAHPFSIDDTQGNSILGVHNGTLQAWAGKENAKDFSVDSEWAMNHILLKGKEAFADFNGAFAMVWWLSETPGVLHMARNKERPLFVAWTEDDNMLYASEAGMLHWLAERNSIKLVGSIKTLEADKLYKFDISNPTSFSKSDLPAYKVVIVPNNNDWYGQRDYSNYETMMDKLTRIFSEAKKEEEEPVVQVPLLPAPDNTRVSKSVTAEEMADAMSLHMMGAKGTFIPYGTDDTSGSLYGEFECKEYTGPLNAVMRDCENVMWESLDTYEVTVLGIKDNGNEFMAIVSKPIRELVQV